MIQFWLFPSGSADGLTIDDDRALLGIGPGEFPRADAQNRRQAIIECRQDPTPYGEVCWIAAVAAAMVLHRG
jgi:hypothetical protein